MSRLQVDSPIEIAYGRRTDRELEAMHAAAADGQRYSINMINNSGATWTFYVYQKLPAQVADVFSLAWFASPFQIRDGNSIKFSWEIDYSFVWSATGVVRPGVDFDAQGVVPCSPSGNNTTEFSTTGGPGLSPPVQGPPAGSLVINDASNVPANTFSVGIGMSGTGTFAVQAGPNLKHTFTPTPTYWIAAGYNVTVGKVLSIDTITQTAEAQFPAAVYALEATLQDDNTWDIQNG
ncbi:MAG: protein rhiA [Acidobacteriota bacterium]